jgi:hypothetical protein
VSYDKKIEYFTHIYDELAALSDYANVGYDE